MEGYSIEKNVQILIAVLKANNIKKVVVDPGTTNISFIVSLVNDGGFEMYSAVDERGAAYIACGLSSASGEPVVITCTGSTASRNYYPGLTEAYHRKLPILAVTASQDFSHNGNLHPQFIDRTIQPVDSIKMSVQIPVVRNTSDEYDCTIKINKAVLELFRNGGGPVHINLATSYQNDFSVSDISHVRILHRITYGEKLPDISQYSKIAIIVGNHKQWSKRLTSLVDKFCSIYDSVVLVDHSSHYWGNYRVLPTIISCQERYESPLFDIDLLIHIGEEHGDYFTETPLRRAKEVWRVSEDGEIRDTYGKLTNTFEMTEEYFFTSYTEGKENKQNKHDYRDSFQSEIYELYSKLPELPFSNIWVAQTMIPHIPSDAYIELGVSNTMRAWTFFDFREETYTLANTGCRGIDGAVPTLIGMSLAEPEKLHFGIMGDLTFFYSFNMLGNKHIGNNLRIVLINNGCGYEFNLYPNRAYKIYKGNHERINEYIAAGGHTGTKSKQLVKHYAEDLGMTYISASNKEEVMNLLPVFTDNKMDKSIIFEIFMDGDGENEALKMIRSLKSDNKNKLKTRIKRIIRR